MARGDHNGFFRDKSTVHKCKWCGKTFDTIGCVGWAYKEDNKYFCSWHCLKAYSDNKDKNRKRSPKSIYKP